MGLGFTELLIIAAVVVLIIGPTAVVAWVFYLMGKNQAGESGTAAADPALETARERFARGEIDREEFESIKSTLGY
jgi:putative membrane protein